MSHLPLDIVINNRVNRNSPRRRFGAEPDAQLLDALRRSTTNIVAISVENETRTMGLIIPTDLIAMMGEFTRVPYISYIFDAHGLSFSYGTMNVAQSQRARRRRQKRITQRRRG